MHVDGARHSPSCVPSFSNPLIACRLADKRQFAVVGPQLREFIKEKARDEVKYKLS